MDPKEKRLAECQRVIGYFFADPTLLETALTHSSLRSPDRDCNERLEFLGDSVLGLVITEELYHLLPDSAEGEMTRIKSAVVSRKSLYRASTQLDLAAYAEYARGVGRRDELPTSVVANLVESVIGAIYLDAGYYPAREFVLRHLSDEIEDVLHDRGAKNYKSLLQHEVQQSTGVTPHYRTVEEEGPDHDKVFIVAAVIQGREWGRASGANKKEAEQDAARLALEAWSRRGRGRRRRKPDDDTVPIGKAARTRRRKKSDATEQVEKAEPAESVANTDKPEKTVKPEKTAKPEKAAKPRRRKRAAKQPEAQSQVVEQPEHAEARAEVEASKPEKRKRKKRASRKRATTEAVPGAESKPSAPAEDEDRPARPALRKARVEPGPRPKAKRAAKRPARKRSSAAEAKPAPDAPAEPPAQVTPPTRGTPPVEAATTPEAEPPKARKAAAAKRPPRKRRAKRTPERTPKPEQAPKAGSNASPEMTPRAEAKPSAEPKTEPQPGAERQPRPVTTPAPPKPKPRAAPADFGAGILDDAEAAAAPSERPALTAKPGKATRKVKGRAKAPSQSKPRDDDGFAF